MQHFPLSCVSVPSLTNATYVNIEHTLGTYLKLLVMEQVLTAGQEEQLAISNKNFDEEFPTITVVVDGGWSKHAHKHSYNVKSGVAVIFVVATKKLPFIGIQNKYWSVCSVSEHKKQPPKEHHCFKNWPDSLCSIKADILLEEFLCLDTSIAYLLYNQENSFRIHS